MQKLPANFLSLIQKEFPKDFLTTEKQELETFGRDWTKAIPPNPSAVVFPHNTAEVAKFLKLCSEHKIAIVPSGGRTGLAAGAVAANGEVVLSLVRMNKIHTVDQLASTLRVEAGAITQAVHEACAPMGLTWPVDFASKGSSTVGGNISTNAGGVKVIHYGLTRQWVLGLQVVTMQGEVLELNGALEKNNTGIDLRQLFIGSEGILGVITEATLKLCKRPTTLQVCFFAVDGMSQALNLFLEAKKASFTMMAFETLTHNCLDAVIANLGVKAPFSEKYPAYVLLEVETPSSPEAQASMDIWLENLFEKSIVLDGTIAQSPREAEEFWTMREGVAESLFRKALPHKNDISLPISELEEFVGAMNSMFAKKYPSLELYVFGHIGDGNLHINTLQPQGMSKEVFLDHCHQVDKNLFELVQKHKGSISAEHGVGLLKKADLHYSRTPLEITLFRGMKKVFDPQNLLNPGKIFD